MPSIWNVTVSIWPSGKGERRRSSSSISFLRLADKGEENIPRKSILFSNWPSLGYKNFSKQISFGEFSNDWWTHFFKIFYYFYYYLLFEKNKTNNVSYTKLIVGENRRPLEEVIATMINKYWFFIYCFSDQRIYLLVKISVSHK